MKAIKDLVPISSPNVLRGMETLDDAGVYKIAAELAIIQTIDFITPIVDDPYSFGHIASANSISDVYTMGGKPVTAMNVVCFPTATMDISVLKEVLRGGMDKMKEAGVVLLGGHSINDAELKYGLSVTGLVHPRKLITHSGARAGDSLVLTKPLGTGIISSAIKAGVAKPETIADVVESMSALNAKAAGIMMELGAHACTDITGFGLLGHASHLVRDQQAGVELNSASIPLFKEAVDFVKRGLYPGGGDCNREYYESIVEFAGYVPDYQQDILFDPQTSGGLLIAIPPNSAEKLVARLHKAGITQAAIVGRLIDQPRGKVLVK